MKFYDLYNKKENTDFTHALFNPLAKDGSLYFPSSIPSFTYKEMQTFSSLTLQEIGTVTLSKWFSDEFTNSELEEITSKVLTFPIPINKVGNTFILELFHGPTLAFKDIGAGFLAQLMNAMLKKRQRKITVLVATSGDTGGAVAAGFSGMQNIHVVIVYPFGKVSKLQEEQLTRVEKNVYPIAINGDFDACQSFVKKAFIDTDLEALHLTSANSINLGRLIPQIIYYIYSYSLIRSERMRFIVPSGNLGNVTAGLYASRMGLPFQAFIAAVNENDSVINYFNSGKFIPQTTIPTISTAMDIGNPSNFIRILELYGNNREKLKKIMSAERVSTPNTVETIKRVYQEYNYLLDPHTAVGYAVADHLTTDTYTNILLATASPLKFATEISKAAGIYVDNSLLIYNLQNREKRGVKIEADYKLFKDTLLNINK